MTKLVRRRRRLVMDRGAILHPDTTFHGGGGDRVTHAPLLSSVPMGSHAPKRRGRKGEAVKRFSLVLASMVALALLVAFPAFAVTVPAVPVSDYGSSLLTELADAIAQIFPYAAAITAFAIGVGMVRRWLGHRKATQV